MIQAWTSVKHEATRVKRILLRKLNKKNQPITTKTEQKREIEGNVFGQPLFKIFYG